MRIIAGFLLTVLGAVITIKAEWMYQNFGVISTFEKFTFLQTSGGSRLFYKILGIFFAILGLLIMTDMHGPLLIWLLKPLFGQWFNI